MNSFSEAEADEYLKSLHGTLGRTAQHGLLCERLNINNEIILAWIRFRGLVVLGEYSYSEEYGQIIRISPKLGNDVQSDPLDHIIITITDSNGQTKSITRREFDEIKNQTPKLHLPDYPMMRGK